MTAPLANCRVVLVRPQIAANVGAVAVLWATQELQSPGN